MKNLKAMLKSVFPSTQLDNNPQLSSTQLDDNAHLSSTQPDDKPHLSSTTLEPYMYQFQ